MDNAFEKARAAYGTGAYDDATLEFLFPQLKESEDERIRKVLLNLVSNDKIAGYTEFYEERGITCDNVISWLEKQKEQKPQLYWHKITAYEKLPCRAYIYKFAYEQKNNFYGKATINGCLIPNEPVTIGCDTWYLPVEDIKNLPKEDELDSTSPMKTVEQKLAWSDTNELVFKDICKHLKEEGYNGWIVLLNALRNGEFQPKQEWSEEDEKKLGKCIDAVSGYYSPEDKQELKNWLKSLPHRFSLSSWGEEIQTAFFGKVNKEAWRPSEEDKRKLNRIYEILGYAADDKGFLTSKRIIGDKEAIELQDFLKSLSPQPPVEWTEEDRRMLRACIEAVGSMSIRGDVQDLRDWLKSLCPDCCNRPKPAGSWRPSEEQEEPEYYQHFDPDC